jgi:hypothetical protein
MYTSSMSNSQKKISIALIVGAILIAGALFLRADTTDIPPTQQEVAVVTQAPERKVIKTLDKNENGIPDWQEVFVNTDPLNLSTEDSTYEAPDTLTEQFALDFFQDMVRAENYGAFGASPEELVQQTSNSLVAQAQDTLLTEKDIIISNDNSLQALNRYGESVAYIVNSYKDSSDTDKGEVEILEEALRNQDKESLAALDSKTEYYKNVLRDTKKLPVPSLSAQDHIHLINSYQAIANDIEAMRSAFDDPMLTLLRIKRYQDDALGLEQSIINVYTSLLDRGASWDNDSIVFSLIGISDDI